MGAIKEQLLEYLERHNLEEVPEGVSIDDVIKENGE